MRASSVQRKTMLALIEQWEQSSISQKDFYQQHNIAAHVFYYWHRCYKKQRASLNTSMPSMVLFSYNRHRCHFPVL